MTQDEYKSMGMHFLICNLKIVKTSDLADFKDRYLPELLQKDIIISSNGLQLGYIIGTIVPNPFTDKIIVTNKSNNPVRVHLYDMLGRQLTIVQNVIGAFNLSVGQFKQACYIIFVTDETTKKQKRRLLLKL